jgi:tripartite motif-containing protein 71
MGNTLSLSRSLSHVREIPCSYGYGVCVALKHGLIIVSSQPGLLCMYSLDDGSLVRSVGKWGDGKGHFNINCGGLSVSPDGDSVLVAEYWNERVQEVLISDGAWVRFVGTRVLAQPEYVDCNADVIAVSESCNHINVFAWHDGTLLTQFGSSGSGPGQLGDPCGIRLLADGSGLIVADSNNDRLCVFGLTGEPVSTIGSKEQGLNYPYDVLECASDGGFIVANCGSYNLVKVSSAGDVLDTHGTCGSDDDAFNGPTALTMLPDGGLAVRDDLGCYVFRGRQLRATWIVACVTVARYGGA